MREIRPILHGGQQNQLCPGKNQTDFSFCLLLMTAFLSNVGWVCIHGDNKIPHTLLHTYTCKVH